MPYAAQHGFSSANQPTLSLGLVQYFLHAQLSPAYPTRPSQSVHVQCSWSSCPTTIFSDASVLGLAPLSISDTVASLIFLNTACYSQVSPTLPVAPESLNLISLPFLSSYPFHFFFLFCSSPLSSFLFTCGSWGWTQPIEHDHWAIPETSQNFLVCHSNCSLFRAAFPFKCTSVFPSRCAIYLLCCAFDFMPCTLVSRSLQLLRILSAGSS